MSLKKLNIISFDIEDWFNVISHPLNSDISKWSSLESRLEASLEKILEILDEKQISATFFIVGWFAKHYPRVLSKIDPKVHHIGSHTYDHRAIYEKTSTQFEADLERSISVISELYSTNVNAFRAPGFTLPADKPEFFEILLKHGIIYDSSLFSASHRHGQTIDQSNYPYLIETKSGSILEFPISKSFKLFRKGFYISGGGYFRITPLFVQKAVLNRNSYTMVYLHPRDLDVSQPRLKMRLIDYFKSYVGIRASEKKLKALSNNSRFINLEAAAQYLKTSLEGE